MLPPLCDHNKPVALEETTFILVKPSLDLSDLLIITVPKIFTFIDMKYYRNPITNYFFEIEFSHFTFVPKAFAVFSSSRGFISVKKRMNKCIRKVTQNKIHGIRLGKFSKIL